MADNEMIGQVIEMASAKPLDQAAWFSRLQRGEKGWLPTLANAMVIFANDPALANMLAYDAFRSQHFLMRSPPPAEQGGPTLPGPYPRSWGLEDVALIQAYLQRVWCSRFGREATEHAMMTAAAVNRFHPVTDWLDTLVWDKKPRINNWLTNAFGCVSNKYHQAIGAKFLIAAVRRVRQPGCKFDHMLVLEGSQGLGKSTAVKVLFGETWFSDTIPADLSDKDAAMALLGIWCLEFAEIEHLIRTEVETIKAFLSRAVDRYRPPYGKAYVERPRQGVLVGTTNGSDYLRDSTGNRRIWPFKCMAADAEWIQANREQLWAEAAFREKQGETIWLEDGEVTTLATKAQSERMNDDVWADVIAEWLKSKTKVRIPDILSDALSVPKERQGRREEMRVGDILRGLGWARHLIWSKEIKKMIRRWYAPGHNPDPAIEEPDEDAGQGDLLE